MQGGEDLADIMARVALRDRTAFQTLYGRTSAKLFGVCLRILGERSDAEEVLQEVYVKVWHNAGLYARTRASPIAWLCAIARNRSIDRLRTRRSGTVELEDAAELSDEQPSPEAAAIATTESRRLGECLKQLETKQAAAIRTAYFGGHTYEEIARGTGVPLGTVKSWIRRGLARLKDCLER